MPNKLRRRRAVPMVTFTNVIWSVLVINALVDATELIKADSWSPVNSLVVVNPPRVTDDAAVTIVAAV